MKRLIVLCIGIFSGIHGSNQSSPKIPLEGAVSASVLIQAPVGDVQCFIANLRSTETTLKSFLPETLEDKERRQVLASIAGHIKKGDVQNNPADYKKLMEQLSQVAKSLEKRKRTLKKEEERRDLTCSAILFDQLALASIIAQIQMDEDKIRDQLGLEEPLNEKREKFWQKTAKLLDAQEITDKELIDLIEKTTEHMHMLSNELYLCGTTFPKNPKFLKIPKRRKPAS